MKIWKLIGVLSMIQALFTFICLLVSSFLILDYNPFEVIGMNLLILLIFQSIVVFVVINIVISFILYFSLKKRDATEQTKITILTITIFYLLISVIWILSFTSLNNIQDSYIEIIWWLGNGTISAYFYKRFLLGI
jgi:hypothetical protein